MKRVLVFAVVVAFLLTLAPAALAAPNKVQGGKKLGKVVFTANGVVKAVDSEAGTVTMRVWSGSRVKIERGKDIVLNVVPGNRKIWRVVLGRAVVTELANVQPGERIWAKGTFTVEQDKKRTYTATRIRLKATWPFMARGTVASVDAAEGSLVVKVTRSMLAMRSYVGEELTFATVKGTLIKKRISGKYQRIKLDQVQAGDTVRINGRIDNRDPADRQFVATKIFVIK